MHLGNLLAALSILCIPFASMAATATPSYTINTNHGTIVVELYPDYAPATVANFMKYADTGFYDDTIFHRVIDGFMIQGGGYTTGFTEKRTDAPIPNEADNGLLNDRGFLAMARTNDPHSATAQFFINLANNPTLNFSNTTTGPEWGYAVFGKVIDGMDVVDAIGRAKTGSRGPFAQDTPLAPVVIETVKKNQEQSRSVYGAAESDCYKSLPSSDEAMRKAVFMRCMADKGYTFHFALGEPETMCFHLTNAVRVHDRDAAFWECMSSFGFKRHSSAHP